MLRQVIVLTLARLLISARFWPGTWAREVNDAVLIRALGLHDGESYGRQRVVAIVGIVVGVVGLRMGIDPGGANRVAR